MFNLIKRNDDAPTGREQLVLQYYRRAKLAENQLLVAALRRDAGEINNDDLCNSAIQYAAAVSDWRLARETQLDEITEKN